jgi:hypothetical protein
MPERIGGGSAEANDENGYLRRIAGLVLMIEDAGDFF